MSEITDKIGKSFGYGRGRRVSVERDGTDFVVAFQPEGHVIFRHHDLKALRQVCSKLRWDVIEEKSFPQNLEDIRTYLNGSE
jgi:predicted nucleic acid-binding OB-fold protein